MNENIILTDDFKKSANAFIAECEAKRKEILDAGKDTADETNIPTLDDIVDDVLYGAGTDSDGDYYNCWGVTDSYNSDYPFDCHIYDTRDAIVIDVARDFLN